MFADTITITVNAVAKVLSRINQDGYSSEYFLRGTTDEFRLTLKNTTYADKKRPGVTVDRHSVDFTHTVYPTTPIPTGIIRHSYTVIENDRVDGVTDPLNFNLGYIAFFSSGNITKLLNWES